MNKISELIDQFSGRARLEQKITDLERQITHKKSVSDPGKIFIVTTHDEVVPYAEFQKYQIQKSTKQVQESETFVTEDNLAVKPYDPLNFLTLYESNPTFHRTVNQIARDVAGLGWKLVPRDEEKGDAKEKNKINEFLNHPNPRMPLRKIAEALIIDWGVIGVFALEVVRADGGEVAEIYHAPAHTIWVHKGEEKNGQRCGSREKFCQRRDGKKIWFKQFGLEKNISAVTGIEGNFTGDAAANEMIFYTTYYPLNDYYSPPSILSAVGSTVGLIEIRDFNLSFFTNHGVPAYVVILSGEWDDGSEKKIAEYLRTEVKGSEDAHKTMVVTLPEGGELKFQPLAIKEREGSFRIFNQIWREDVLSSYSMPAYRVGIMPTAGRLGSGSEARELTEIYKQGVIDPLQNDLEDIINFQIIEQGLNCKSWWWRLNDIDVRDYDKEIERYNSLVEHGVMMPNQVRARLDLGEPYPGGNRFYISTSLTEVPPGKKGGSAA